MKIGPLCIMWCLWRERNARNYRDVNYLCWIWCFCFLCFVFDWTVAFISIFYQKCVSFWIFWILNGRFSFLVFSCISHVVGYPLLFYFIFLVNSVCVWVRRCASFHLCDWLELDFLSFCVDVLFLRVCVCRIWILFISKWNGVCPFKGHDSKWNKSRVYIMPTHLNLT